MLSRTMKMLLQTFFGLFLVNMFQPTFVRAVHTMSQVKEMKLARWEEARQLGLLGGLQHDSILNSPSQCVNGKVNLNGEDFPCDKVDFLALLSLKDLNITGPSFPSGTESTSDLWGWFSPDNKEITICCLNNGVVLIDSTDATSPLILAKIAAGRNPEAWCDVKVYENTLYIVQDAGGSPDYGIAVFNLTRLVGLEASPDLPLDLEPDFVYADHTSSHNIAINVDTGYLYSVGTQTCNGGLHIVNLNGNPLAPTFSACGESDGYTHDVQCVLYDGPDMKYQGSEICFGFNEDSLTIYDVSNKANITIISKTCYPGMSYTHQGWLNDDLSILLLDDELDEVDAKRANTTTYFMNVSNLRNVDVMGYFTHPTRGIDHNLYVWGSIHKRGWTGSPAVVEHSSTSYAYFANYASGLRIGDISRVHEKIISQVGYFDIAPDIDEVTFMGAWSSYMHPSGTIAVTSIERGLFFLNFTEAFVEPSSTGIPPFEGDPEEDCPSTKPFADWVVALYALSGTAFAVILLATMYVLVRRRNVTEKQLTIETWKQ